MKSRKRGPHCPRCGSTRFVEYQTVEEKQSVEWINGELCYGQADFQSIVSVDGITCENCGEELDVIDFLKQSGKIVA